MTQPEHFHHTAAQAEEVKDIGTMFSFPIASQAHNADLPTVHSSKMEDVVAPVVVRLSRLLTSEEVTEEGGEGQRERPFKVMVTGDLVYPSNQEVFHYFLLSDLPPARTPHHLSEQYSAVGQQVSAVLVPALTRALHGVHCGHLAGAGPCGECVAVADIHPDVRLLQEMLRSRHRDTFRERPAEGAPVACHTATQAVDNIPTMNLELFTAQAETQVHSESTVYSFIRT